MSIGSKRLLQIIDIHALSDAKLMVKPLYALIMFILLAGCSGWKFGFTSLEASHSYYLITGNASDFGNKRIQVNRQYHKNSQLASFLDKYEAPDFAYEYENSGKCHGIQLFYLEKDSTFVFEELEKNAITSISLIEARKMDSYEYETYERLKDEKTTPHSW